MNGILLFALPKPLIVLHSCKLRNTVKLYDRPLSLALDQENSRQDYTITILIYF